MSLRSRLSSRTTLPWKRARAPKVSKRRAASAAAGDEPGERAPELTVFQMPGSVVDGGDGVGACVALAVVVDPGGEGVEAGVGGSAGQHLTYRVGFAAGAVGQAGEQVVRPGWLQPLQDGDGPRSGLPDAPGGGDTGRVVLGLEGQTVHLPPVGRAVRVAFDGQAAALEVLDLAVAGAGEEGQDQIAGVLQQTREGGEAVALGVVGQDRLDPGLAVQTAADGLVADGLGSGSDDGGGLVDHLPVAGEGDPVAAQRVRD